MTSLLSKRNIPYRIEADFLKHSDHGRIIVPEYIEFQQVMIDGVVIKWVVTVMVVISLAGLCTGVKE